MFFLFNIHLYSMFFVYIHLSSCNLKKDRQYNGQTIKIDKTIDSCSKTFSFLCSILPTIICFFVLFRLAIVLSIFFVWPLYCLSFSFGHCIVYLFRLAIVLSIFFVQWPNEKDRQYNGQTKKIDNTMAKRKR
jgi:hypothetical protein